tara:strand:- start:903 stop:1130 length:228 start_codon:yes stop_codon:yes gene_type:complete
MLKPIKNPPISFVKTEIYNAIANSTIELLEKEKKGEITSSQFNVQAFPANALSTIDNAIKNAIELFNSEENNDES